jgi:hypothetical protein
MGNWLITVPEAGTNMALNPSAEKTGNFSAHNSATVARSTTYARFGDYSYSVTLGATNRGINLTTASLTATDSYVTFYVHGTITGTLQASLNSGSNYTAASIIGGATGGWVRYGALVVAAQVTSTGTACIIRDTANDTLIYIDGVQVEQLGYYTDYIDGTLPGCKWSGLYHGSSSSRDAQYRLSGRQRDLETVYNVRVRQMPGAGFPIIRNNIQPYSLQPGGEFQSYNVDVRRMSLVIAPTGTTAAQLHSRRKDFFNLIKPDARRGAQPFRLWYTGANSGKYVYADFRYDGGGELGEIRGGGNWIESAGEVPINIVGDNPYWYEDTQETSVLDYTDSISAAAYGLRRHDGQWKALGTGFGNFVYVVAEDKQRGRIYFGGAFTTANGVTVNRITYWNGNTFVAMGNGVAGGNVNAIAIAANGDVWVGGGFTTVDGVASRNYIARWNVSSSTWTHFGTTGTGPILGIAISPIDGLVYVAGGFINWGGNAGQDYITSYNGSAWVDVGVSPFSATAYISHHSAMTVDSSGNLYVGELTTAAAVANLRKWDGSAWSVVLSTDSAINNSISAILLDSDGSMILGGTFSTLGGASASNIALYNLTSVYPLGSGTDNTVYTIKSVNGGILVSGNFSTAGGLTLADNLAFWNGTTWTHVDVNLPGSAIVFALVISSENIYAGFDTTGTATASGITTVSPNATAETYPRLTVINGNTSGTCTLQWLENQSSKHRLYFNLVVNAGETVWFNLSENGKSLISDWRGSITDNPLKNSDVTNWKLLPSPASNTIATFITGTTTSVTALLHWTPRHWSIDGVAA